MAVFTNSPNVVNIGYQSSKQNSLRASKASMNFSKALTKQRVKDNAKIRQFF